jgi:hypothetical protein
MDFSHELGWFF